MFVKNSDIEDTMRFREQFLQFPATFIIENTSGLSPRALTASAVAQFLQLLSSSLIAMSLFS
jgi:hypothetical protein